MAKISQSMISAAVAIAKDENAADPCAWLEDQKKLIVRDAIAQIDDRFEQSSQNGKSVTLWNELESWQKCDILDAACRAIRDEEAEGNDEIILRTSGRVRYGSLRYGNFV